MNEKTMIKGIVMMTVAIIIVLGTIVPVISSSMETSGDPITKTNTGTGRTFKEMIPGDVLKCVSTYSDGSRTDVWTLNDNTVLNEGITGLTWDWGLISDVYFMQVNAPANSAIGSGQAITSTPGSISYYSGADSTNPNKTFTWTLSEDMTLTYTLMIGDTQSATATYTPTWVYVVSTIEDGAYMSAQVTTNPYFAKEGNKDIILAGNYTTGDLDTGYYYGKDGVLTVVNTSYTGTVNFTQDLSDGTTDIYDTKVTVTITDGSNTEEFSPYRALVPYQVQGHADSGTVYTMLGVIPLVIVVSLLIGAVTIFLRQRN